MRYGQTFNIDLYLFEEERGETIMTRPIDYLETKLWRNKHLAKLPEEVVDFYSNYAIAFFALKRMGKLDEYGLSDEPLTLETLEDFAARSGNYVQVVAPDSLPMKAQTK